MSYLPGLRSSLVEAAQRRYADAPEPDSRRRGRRWLTTGSVATALATATAVAVAVVALVVLGHRQSTAGSGSRPVPTRSDLRQSAVQLLGHMALPSGAVRSGLVPGTPADLWSPSSKLALQYRVDVHRVWRLTETPDRVIAFIEKHRPPGSSLGIGGESSGSVGGGGIAPPAGSRASGQTMVYSATMVIDFPATPAGIWRQLALDAVALHGGGTALRVDSQAGWLMPRPAGERIPPSVAKVAVTFTGRKRGQRESVVVTSRQRVQEFISVFNSLPTAWAGSRQCQRGPVGSISFAFEGPGRMAPLALAVLKVPCNTMTLTIGGRSEAPLLAGFAGAPFTDQLYHLVALSLAPRRSVGSYTRVQRCSLRTSVTPAQSQSARGAAAASCASASRSTTSASSP